MKRTFSFIGLLLTLLLAGCGSSTSAGPSQQAAASPTLAASPTPAAACTPRSSGQTSAAPAAPSVYLSANDGAIYALNGADGKTRWKFSLGGNGKTSYTGPLALDHNVLYVSSSDDTVYALNSSDGTLRWRVDCPLDGLGLVAPVVSNGVAYVAGAETLYALRASDGKEVWHKRIGNEDVLPFTVDGDAIYVHARDATSGTGMLVALSAATGAQRWSAPIEGAAYSTPLVAAGVVYVSEASTTGPDSYLYALNASDSTQRWRLQQTNSFLSLVAGQGVIYTLTGSVLLAINSADGTQRWRVPASASVLAAANGMLYLGAQDAVTLSTATTGSVAALSADTGTQRWRSNIQGGMVGGSGGLAFLRPFSGALDISTPVVFNGVVAIWLNGVTSALDASTGQALWQATVGDSYRSYLAAG